MVVQTEARDCRRGSRTARHPAIETGLNGVAGLHSIRSSRFRIVVITVCSATDGYLPARQLVGERLNEVAGTSPTPFRRRMDRWSARPVRAVHRADLHERTLMDLRTFADWTLRPRLLGVPGVAKVDIFGGEIRQLQVQVDPIAW